MNGYQLEGFPEIEPKVVKRPPSPEWTEMFVDWMKTEPEISFVTFLRKSSDPRAVVALAEFDSSPSSPRTNN